MRNRSRLVVVLASLALLGVVGLRPSPAAAVDCSASDPFTPALRAEVASRFPGHHMTATAYDSRSGCTWHLAPGQRVTTASVVKVEVGSGILLRAQQQGRGLTQLEFDRFWPMITQSANAPTTLLWQSLGGAPGMAQLDRTFGLTSTVPSSPYWGLTSTIADDQVHLLRQVLLGQASPLDAAHRATLSQAMASVVPSQRWGVSAGAPAGARVRLKNGFASSACCGWRINSVGVVDHAGGPVAMAILSDGWASEAQGIPAVEVVARAINQSAARLRTVGLGSTSTGAGYWMARGDGAVVPFGDAVFAGDLRGQALNGPVIGLAARATGGGYWLVASDGGVFPFGGAGGYGSTGALQLNKPIISLTPTPSGAGYWLVASDGGVFPFGDAPGLGSTGAMRLNQPIIGLASTPSGAGYWLVAADGGLFPFGDAPGIGSLGGSPIPRPIVGVAGDPGGVGYWMVASDGRVYPFGHAAFLGSTVGVALAQPVQGLTPTPDGLGYWLFAADGGVFPFGNAPGLGSLA
ncbi:MAG: serine hydrolase [Acidimicrobiales bacterium]